MRDAFLQHVHTISEREKIWKPVKALVKQNSNVRMVQRENKNGDMGLAWEWIGPSPAIEGGSGRRQGRVSWGADGNEEDKSTIHKKWDEPGSRPVY